MLPHLELAHLAVGQRHRELEQLTLVESAWRRRVLAGPAVAEWLRRAVGWRCRARVRQIRVLAQLTPAPGELTQVPE